MCKGQLTICKSGIEVHNSHIFPKNKKTMIKEIELQAISLHYTNKEYKNISNILSKLKYPKNKLGGMVTDTYAYIICKKESYEKLYKDLSIKNIRVRGEVAKTKYVTHLKNIPVVVNSDKINTILKNIEEMTNS